MRKTIYTIGYTAFDIDSFIEQLKELKITCVIDVRSYPRSKYYCDYNCDVLKNRLAEDEILYRNYSHEFGARQNNKYLYPNGYLDFDMFAQTENFKQGIKKLERGIEMGQTFVLMCAEKDPYNCHRCIMISRFLNEHDFEIIHIIGYNKFITQKDIEERLLDDYFPKRKQFSLFEEDNLSDEECLLNAYKKRNKDIGFKIEEV